MKPFKHFIKDFSRQGCLIVRQLIKFKPHALVLSTLLSLSQTSFCGGGSDGGGNNAIPKFMHQAQLLYDQLAVNPHQSQKVLGFELDRYKDALLTDVTCAPPALLDYMSSKKARAYFFREPHKTMAPPGLNLDQKKPTIFIDCDYWEQIPEIQINLSHKINIFHEYLRALNLEGHANDGNPYLRSSKLSDIPIVRFDSELMCKEFYANEFPNIKNIYEQYQTCFKKAQNHLHFYFENLNHKTDIKIDGRILTETELAKTHFDLFELLKNKNYFIPNGLPDYTLFETSVEPLVIDYLNHHRSLEHNWALFHTGLLGCVGFSPLENQTWRKNLPTKIVELIQWPRNKLDFQHVLCIQLDQNSEYRMDLCSFADQSHYISTDDQWQEHPVRYCTRAALSKSNPDTQFLDLKGYYEFYGNKDTVFSDSDECPQWWAFAKSSHTTVRYQASPLNMQEWVNRVYLRQWNQRIDKCLLGNEQK